jgi:2,4-dienoyl-CoA reductase (NADPH2)
VEILETPLADMGMSVRWVLLSRLKKQGVPILTSSEVVEVHEGGVRVRTPEGKKEMAARSIVFAVGSVPDSEMLEKINATQTPHCVIGDSKKPRKIKDAVHEGYWAATTWVDSL